MDVYYEINLYSDKIIVWERAAGSGKTVRQKRLPIIGDAVDSVMSIKSGIGIHTDLTKVCIQPLSFAGFKVYPDSGVDMRIEMEYDVQIARFTTYYKNEIVTFSSKSFDKDEMDHAIAYCKKLLDEGE